MFKNGTWFPYMLVAILVISVAGNIYMVMTATNDPSFAVEPDYYKKAVEWDRLQAEKAASEALGWNMLVDARTDELRIRLTDRLGRPIDGATVDVEAFPNARASQRVRGYMVPKGRGVYVLEHAFDQKGLWEYRLAAVVDEKRFTQVSQKELP